jgi:hypothetical protein
MNINALTRGSPRESLPFAVCAITIMRTPLVVVAVRAQPCYSAPTVIGTLTCAVHVQLKEKGERGQLATNEEVVPPLA